MHRADERGILDQGDGLTGQRGSTRRIAWEEQWCVRMKVLSRGWSRFPLTLWIETIPARISLSIAPQTSSVQTAATSRPNPKWCENKIEKKDLNRSGFTDQLHIAACNNSGHKEWRAERSGDQPKASARQAPAVIRSDKHPSIRVRK